MNVDSGLRIEIISSLLGQTIKPYDKKTRGVEDVLSVDDFHLHNLTGRRQAHSRKPLIKEEDFFDPEYDCDFTNLSDSAGCSRGDELYERPKGWYRMALKVKGKYPDGDAWLGPKGWRSHSAAGEWPVSYHGTSLDGAKGIIKSHYSAGNGDLYGRGVYSTPDVHVAEREEYAKTFTSKTTGRSYKVILQNRINPKVREICQRFDYWLVPVRKGASAAEERKTVESSIRPYGILIKELNDDQDGDGDEDESGDSSSHEEEDGTDDDYGDDTGRHDGSVTDDEDDGDDISDDDDDDDDEDDDDDGDGEAKHDDGSTDDIWEDENGSGDDDDDESDDDDGDDEGGYDGGKYDDDCVDGSCADDDDDDDDDDEDDCGSDSEDDDDWS